MRSTVTTTTIARPSVAWAVTWFALLLILLVGLPATALAQSQSSDATLSALTVSPRDIIGFAGDRTSYQVGVASTETRATITATANHSGASVTYSPTDADTSTTVYDVDLTAGRNAVTVTVTAEDGTTTKDYTVGVNRGVTDNYGWKPVDDLDGLIAAGNTSPVGIWSDGTTMWVSDSSEDKLYAYGMSDKAHDASKDFNTLIAAGNETPTGIWSDGTTMWVADWTDHKLYAYRMTDKVRDESKDFETLIAAGNETPTGIWSDGTTMWVADWIDGKIYAYRMTDKVRDESKDFETLIAADNEAPWDIWSDGTTMWVADFIDDKLYAYNLNTKARDSTKDFNTLIAAGNDFPTGIWSDGMTMWVADAGDDKVYSYNKFHTVSFGAAAYTVAEGGSVTVSVTLSADPERTVEIPITTTNEGGATGADYSGVPARVTFNAGDTAQTFTFTATDDAEDDDDERVRLSFGTLPTGVTAGSTATGTVSITDNDDPAVTVSFEQAGYTVAEGSSVTVRVTLSADPERTVEIPITKTNEGGATAADYSGVPASVTFDSGDTAQTFTFTATDDAENDDGESVSIGFGTLPDQVTAGTPGEATVSITDDAVPSVTVSFGAAAYTVAEGGSVTVSVTLSADPERTVTVPITTTDQGGATGADYSGVPARVTFNAGDTAQTFTFTATDDAENDDDESVRLAFGTLPTGVTAGSTATGTVSITDDDGPAVTVSFGQAAYTVAEGGSVTVRVTLSADPERTVEIPVTTTGQDGATGADYSGVPANVIFNSGDTVQTFTFTATPDTDNDDGESVVLGFGALPNRVSQDTTNEATVSITDDDVPAVTASFEQAEYTVAEGGSVEVTVTLDIDPERTVEVPITVTPQDGATAADYSGAPFNVTFDAGDTAQTFTFTATQDADNDDGESVRLSFGALPDQVTAGAASEATVSITDDDVPSVMVSFEQSSYTVDEGSSVEVTVTLDIDPERTVEVPITVTPQDGATAADYSGAPFNVTFDAGDTAQTFTFTATQDTDNDDGESVRLSFGTLPDQVTAGATSEATVSITDDDVPSVMVSFEQSSYTVDEGSSVEVTVTLDIDPERTVTVPITTTDQDGATGADYSGVPANVIFNSGETATTFTFTATDDAEDDDDESVSIGFGTLPNGVTAGTPSETTVSITDNDDVPSVTVSFEQATYSATEGGDDAEVTVRLSSPAPRQVDIPLTAEGLYKATPDDWSGVPAALTFSTGDTSQSFTVVAFDDTVEDNGEMVELRFGALPDGFTAGSPATATITLLNDDEPNPVDVTTEPDGLADYATLCLDTRATLTVGVAFSGTLGTLMDIDAIKVALTAGTMGYKVVLLDHNDLEMSAEHYTFGMIHPDGMYVNYPYLTNWVNERDNLIIIPEETGTYCVEIRDRFSDGPYMQDYKILVSELNPLANPATGPESASPGGDAVEGIPTNPDHFHRIRVGSENAIAGELSDQDDRDWYIAQLENGLYRVTVEGDGTGKGALAFPNLLHWESDAREFNQESSNYLYSESGWLKEFLIEESTSGSDIYHFEVLSAGGYTGTYTITVETIEEFTDPQERPGSSGQRVSNTPATGAPGISGTPAVGETLTATTSRISDEDGLSNAVFAYQWIRHDLADQTDADIPGETAQTYTVTSDDEAKGLKVRVTFTDDAGNQESLTSNAYLAAPPVLDTSGASDEPAANSPATGPPTITGTARVAETLTADASDIEDPDGMDDAAFTFRWAAGGNDIAGATAASYILTADEEGLAITVRVSFTDDAGNPEALTSAATEAVAAPPPLTAEFPGAPASHDGQTAFTFELRFSEEFPISYTTLRDHAFTVTGGSVTKVRRLEPPGNVRWEITVRPDSEAVVTVELPPTTDCDNQGAVCTEDGRRLSNSLELVVSGPGQ